jgi:protein-tyrosine-phosphatase
VISSGTVADEYRVSNQTFFASSLELLARHGLSSYVKTRPEQLTQRRVDGQDITICMNQVVVEEAKAIVSLPEDTLNWNITDIGEGNRIIRGDNRQMHEEAIYQEITRRVDDLVHDYNLSKL